MWATHASIYYTTLRAEISPSTITFVYIFLEGLFIGDPKNSFWFSALFKHHEPARWALLCKTPVGDSQDRARYSFSRMAI